MAAQEHKGRVVRLEIENFKSYRGTEVIGPFKHFTTIIGPNGSGKSNLMDAISFVLGVKTGVLRGSNLRELLYLNSDSEDPADHPDRGQVTLVFEAPDGEEVRFTRAIAPTSAVGDAYASTYRLDGRAVSAEAYNARLESYGILVRARNFLVFQGDIESVAQMSPKDLTAMFETISGSAALRREYEEAEARQKDAESAMTVVFSRRKAIAAEKRQRKEQKAEAERHMGLAAELEGARTRHALWQAHHLLEDAKDARARKAELGADLAAATEGAAKAEAAAEEHRRRQAGVAKQRLLKEKAMAKKRAEAEKKNPGLIKAREAIAHTQRRLAAAHKEGETARRRAAEHAEKLASLRQQLAQLEDAQRAVQAEIDGGGGGGGGGAAGSSRRRKSLSPELLAEYNETKRAVGAKTAKQEAEREALQAGADADAEALRLLQESVAGVEARIVELEAAGAEDEARLARATEAVEKATAERAAKEKEKTEAEKDRRRAESRRTQLERRLEELEGTLREAKAESKQSAREAARRALVDHLKAAFPRRVFGIVTDLADTLNDRDKLAMSVVLGKDFDSVVVDTPETAMACIQVVKERRMPPMTFLPADTIRVKEVDPALRALGGGARLAVDCLGVKDERVARAFQSICGATLLCDTVAQAKELAYGGPQRHKVVALDGTAFLKTGIITGGVTASMEERAKKWEGKEVGQAKEDAARVAAELKGLPRARELSERVAAAAAAIARLSSTIQFASADAKATQQRVAEGRAAAAALRRERDAKAPGAAKLEAQAAARGRRLAELQAAIDAVAEREFAAFAKKIGVASIAEYEGRHLKEAERLAERRLAVANQVARVKNQLDYEARADPAAEAARLETQAGELAAELEALREEERGHEAAAAGAKAELEDLGRAMAELKGTLEELEAEGKELRKRARAAADAVATTRRSIAGVESRLEQIRAALGDVLEAADMDGVALPRVTGRRAAAALAELSDDDDDAGGAAAMEVDGGDGAGPSSAGPKAARKAALLDYTSLTEDDRRREAAARERHGADMRAGMEALAAQLARMAPNLKAVEQYEEVKGREREQVEEVEAARRECKAAAEAFNALRQRRFDLFNVALAHITAAIDPIYKELTRSALHPSGGQAYLAPETPEEPFSGGIKFSAMPPTKRFRDMEQLSGGEKTVAALALLFAVHSFHPSPFFVLDEVDAALDASNVAKVAAYMRAKTRPGAPGAFQGIVISLKDVFYEKADALVGVCRSPAHGSSETLTFDLNRFGPPMGAAQ